MSRLKHTLFIILTSLAGADVAAQPTSSVTYEVVFESTWSDVTHPIEFPGSAHFSGLIGGTHDDRVTFWAPGELASDGIESMAETGQKGTLTAEVEAAIVAGTAEFILSGGGINPSPGSRSLGFEISPEKPLVTLVSMVAPSPDWFVGVHGLNMIEDGAWRDTVTVTLDVYDAGTDSGTSYGSPDDDTDPAQAIAILNTGSFAQSSVVGTYTFTRQEVVGTSQEVPDAWEVIGPYPNPASGDFTLAVSSALSEPVRVALYDVIGRSVSDAVSIQRGGDGTIKFDVSRVPKGVYFVRLSGADRVATRSVVVR